MNGATRETVRPDGDWHMSGLAKKMSTRMLPVSRFWGCEKVISWEEKLRLGQDPPAQAGRTKQNTPRDRISSSFLQKKTKAEATESRAGFGHWCLVVSTEA
jgi:hypothetical protein